MSITRRQFIETTVASPAFALLGKTKLPKPEYKPAHKIKRGVAMYSYQEEFYLRQMSVEDILREMSDIGAYGIEVMPEMMVPNFPNPSDAWVDQWHGWMDEYKTFPAAYTQFIDTMRTNSRNLTVAEGVETMLRDIRLAKRLGVPHIRSLVGTPIPILEATLPYLEEHDIWLGIELHAPIQIKSRLIERILELSERSTHFGIVPDFGIFQDKPNPFLRDRQIRDGLLTRDAALYIEEAWTNKVAKEKVVEVVSKMKAGPRFSQYINTVYNINPQDAKDLLPFLSKCKHIHGKTWGLNEDCTDPAIDISSVIPILIEGGFEGVIATEYEGQRMMQDVYPLSAVEMVRRYHVSLKRLLGE